MAFREVNDVTLNLKVRKVAAHESLGNTYWIEGTDHHGNDIRFCAFLHRDNVPVPGDKIAAYVSWVMP